MKKNAIVSVQLAQLYTKPEKGTCIDEILYGMPVEVIEHNNEFCYVNTHYLYKGWLEKCALTFIDENDINNCAEIYENYFSISENKYSKQNIKYTSNNFTCDKQTKRCNNTLNECSHNSFKLKKYFVTAPFTDVMSKPDVKGVILQSIPRGGCIAVFENSGEPQNLYKRHIVGSVQNKECNFWKKALLVSGEVGYVKETHLKSMPCLIESARAISTDMQKKMRDNLCDNALQYMGAQYRWGGKTSLGIDCSGLVQMAYMVSGILIYRDAVISKNSTFAVREIPFSKAKHGDLLYFTGHVAMYLGAGKFVHSTDYKKTNGVMVNSLSSANEDYRQDLHENLYCVGSVF